MFDEKLQRDVMIYRTTKIYALYDTSYDYPMCKETTKFLIPIYFMNRPS